jgi:hypothetical protein
MATNNGPTVPHNGGTCAVVSSSGVLSLHAHGAAIDAADHVFRFNLASTLGQDSLAGRREEYRFVNEKVMKMWANWEELEMLQPSIKYSASCSVCGTGTWQAVTLDQYVDFVMQVSLTHPDVQIFASDLKLEYVLKEFFHQLYGVGPSPAGVTTGAVGMAIALATCDEVRAYGMADSATAADAPYHYWGEKHFGLPEHHHKTFNAEKDLWRRLASNSDVDSTDVAVIPGLSRVECPR